MIYGMEKNFSPSYNVYQMQEEVLPNPELLCNAFRERVYGYYIKPAKIVSAFAQGVLCSTLIDFLAKILYPELSVGNRIRKFLEKKIKFSQENAKSFYYYVRNGLIHEGRVKCGCYLDNEIEDTVQNVNGVLKFNPDIILKELEKWFKEFSLKIVKNEGIYHKVRDYIEKSILNEDLEAIEKRHNGIKFPCQNFRKKKRQKPFD